MKNCWKSPASDKMFGNSYHTLQTYTYTILFYKYIKRTKVKFWKLKISLWCYSFFVVLWKSNWKWKVIYWNVYLIYINTNYVAYLPFFLFFWNSNKSDLYFKMVFIFVSKLFVFHFPYYIQYTYNIYRNYIRYK